MFDLVLFFAVLLAGAVKRVRERGVRKREKEAGLGKETGRCRLRAYKAGLLTGVGSLDFRGLVIFFFLSLPGADPLRIAFVSFGGSYYYFGSRALSVDTALRLSLLLAPMLVLTLRERVEVE